MGVRYREYDFCSTVGRAFYIKGTRQRGGSLFEIQQSATARFASVADIKTAAIVLDV
jgi:hypothetical protein